MNAYDHTSVLTTEPCWGDAEARAEKGEELILSADQETPWLHPQSSKHTCAPDQDYGHECVFQRQERVDLPADLRTLCSS